MTPEEALPQPNETPEIPQETTTPQTPPASPTPEAAGGLGSTPVEETGAYTPPPEDKPPSKARRFLRRVFRWAIGLLIVFGLGFSAALWLFYRPARQQAQQATAQAQQAQKQAQDLQAQVALLQKQNSALQKSVTEQSQAMHTAASRWALAEAQANACAARLALQNGDTTGAQLYTERLQTALQALKANVPAAQQPGVEAMLSDLQDLKARLDSPNYAARQLRVIQEHLDTLGKLLFGG